jgi:hypothetical protein
MNGYVIENSDGKFLTGNYVNYFTTNLQDAIVYSNRRYAEKVAKPYGATVKRHGDVREFEMGNRLYDHK